MKTIIFILLLVVLVKAILLYKITTALPLNELRRRARAKKTRADQAIYKLASFCLSLSVFIWLVGGLSGGFLFIILTRDSWLVGILFIFLISWILFSSRFEVKPGGRIWQLAGLAATPVTFVLSFLHPAISSIAKFSHAAPGKTKLFEGEDLIELLNKQARQTDNRIDERELKIAKGALGFTHKTVNQVMTPISEVRWLTQSEIISPKLMDELHKTGHSRFPVVKGPGKSTAPEVVGGLYIKDLLKNLDKSGTVAELMVGGSSYIGESHTLYQALDAFLKSKQHLLVVVNNFEEITGVLTLEDVLGQILGEEVGTDFENYHNKHAVAGHEAGDPKVYHQETKPSKLAE